MKKLVLFVAFAMVAISLSFVATDPAHASPAPVEICNNANNLLVCMNRQGGGTSDGTHVIGYTPGDQNNDFEWLHENDLCGGAVTATCPFLNPTLDQLYHGYAIVRIYDQPDNRCVVNGNSIVVNGITFVLTVLHGCNISGHAYVLPGCLGSDFINCADIQFHNVVNVDSTNAGGDNGPARCLAWWPQAIRNQLTTNDDCQGDAQDAFQQTFF